MHKRRDEPPTLPIQIDNRTPDIGKLQEMLEKRTQLSDSSIWSFLSPARPQSHPNAAPATPSRRTTPTSKSEKMKEGEDNRTNGSPTGSSPPRNRPQQQAAAGKEAAQDLWLPLSIDPSQPKESTTTRRQAKRMGPQTLGKLHRGRKKHCLESPGRALFSTGAAQTPPLPEPQAPPPSPTTSTQ
ncbi:hypothetical protein PVAP13_2NG390903 [Panicum virgatum]|uniref:Uncharacterized protein n=2 Tax=Panicum virgatum TaxID=38727 RepID=A0A8T0VKU5_PANVG|nr:hypothetical protein PVAP13_2NG390903 [Panicum virgatum]